MKVIVLGIIAAGLMSLVFGFHLTTGFSRPTAPPVIVRTDVHTYPVPTMPSIPAPQYHVTPKQAAAAAKAASKPPAGGSSASRSTSTGSNGSTAYTQTSTAVKHSTSITAKGTKTNINTTTTTVKVHQ